MEHYRVFFFFFSSRRRHTRSTRDWSSDVCSSDLTLVEIEARTREQARALGVQVSWTQTNHEGELVDAIQRLKGKADGLMINAAAFTHTSLAVRDALLAVRVPFVEVHLSNIFAREPERRRSVLADAAVGLVAGFGAESYRLGLE